MCEVCDSKEMTIRCKKCGGDFCAAHILLENHGCPSLKAVRTWPAYAGWQAALKA